jgi:hypothetical protein
MGKFSTTIEEATDTMEVNVTTKSKAKTTVSDGFEPTEPEGGDPVAEVGKIDPTNPETQPPPQWQQDQNFKPMPSNPPPPENLEEATPDLDKLSDATKAEMKAGKEATESARGASKHEAQAGQDAADKYGDR